MLIAAAPLKIGENLNVVPVFDIHVAEMGNLDMVDLGAVRLIV